MAKISVSAAERIGKISPLIYGTMIENWGEQDRHAIYGSVWVGEDSPIPSLRGLRADVLEATSRMRPTIVRWPGGCPADVWVWWSYWPGDHLIEIIYSLYLARDRTGPTWRESVARRCGPAVQ